MVGDFFLPHLEYFSFHCLLACMLFAEKSNVLLVLGKLFYSLASFKISSFFLIFLQFAQDMYIDFFVVDSAETFCLLILLKLSELPESVVQCLSLIWENSQPLLLEIFHLFLFSSPCDIFVMCTLHLLSLSHPEFLEQFCFLYSFCCCCQFGKFLFLAFPFDSFSGFLSFC